MKRASKSQILTGDFDMIENIKKDAKKPIIRDEPILEQ